MTITVCGNILEKEVFGEEGKGEGTQAKVERIDLMEVHRRVLRSMEEGAWQTVSLNSWTPKLFLMEDKPLGLELQRSFGALGETGSEQEIPLASSDDVPLISREFEQTQEKEARNKRMTARLQRETSLYEVKQEVTDVAELRPLIRVEDTDDQPGHHAVSDSSRWMSGCSMTRFHESEKCAGQWSN